MASRRARAGRKVGEGEFALTGGLHDTFSPSIPSVRLPSGIGARSRGQVPPDPWPVNNETARQTLTWHIPDWVRPLSRGLHHLSIRLLPSPQKCILTVPCHLRRRLEGSGSVSFLVLLRGARSYKKDARNASSSCHARTRPRQTAWRRVFCWVSLR